MFYLACDSQGQYGRLSFTRLITETGLVFLKEWVQMHPNTSLLPDSERVRLQTLLTLLDSLPTSWAGLGGFEVKSNDLTCEEWESSEVLFRGASHIDFETSSFQSIETPVDFDFSAHHALLQTLMEYASLSATLSQLGVTYEAFQIPLILKSYQTQPTPLLFPYNPEQAWANPSGIVAVFEEGYYSRTREFTPSLIHAWIFEHEEMAHSILPEPLREKATLCRVDIQWKGVLSHQVIPDALEERLIPLEREQLSKELLNREIQQKLRRLEELQRTHPHLFSNTLPTVSRL